MAENWIAGALMGQTLQLDDGRPVRLRLARSSDARAIAELLAAQATSFDDVDPLELVQYDPRCRYVVCATALVDGLITLVGVGAIDLTAEGEPEPDLLIVDPGLGGALAELMWRVLVWAARGASQARAA